MFHACPHKQHIAERFSNAAPHYDKVAHLQQRIGQQLLQYIQELAPHPASIKLDATSTTARTPVPVQRILDLGCGTAYFSTLLKQLHPNATVYASDLAEGMLHYAQQQQRADFYLACDMEALTLADHSMDLIFSSLAIQWLPTLDKLLLDTHRITKPGAIFAFSTVLDGSLFELGESWRRVDGHSHINQFRTLHDYQTALQHSPFRVRLLQPQRYYCYYEQVIALQRELKQLGASHLHSARSPGLRARAQLQQLKQHYEQYRTPQGLPATWEILFVILEHEA